MASFSTSHYFIPLTFLILFLKIQAFDPVSVFSFTNFEKGPKFESSLAIYGNAKVINGGSELVLSSGSGSSSGSGKIMIKKQIKLFEGNTMELVTFSTYFAFSISLDDKDGLAFVMVPSGFESEVFDNSSSYGLRESGFKVIGVEFSATRDGKIEGFAYCNVNLNVGNSVIAKISSNFSMNMGLSRGQKLHAWIDYEGFSNRFEVRLSQYSNSRPIDPLLSHTINFSNVWDAREMFVGFRPVNGDSSQPCSLSSWRFVEGFVPYWMHSKPLNPLPKFLINKDTETPAVKARSDCLLRVLAAMIFGAGCGSLVAFVMLYVWTIFSNRRPVAPEEYVMQPVEFEYKKVNIVVDKAIKDGKE
ncbi:hypothetical protein TanjilG_14467 [Lupinus angustifolius]|uniref:Legume lectin domain-containing protein n=1 Tax=Lupinus angustifolius TaxID=3871 RepID=A0A1J7HYJ3_LUPAN|nr:PREDICTED: L-type lectin-domain containing receptor kinase VIII.2-like [Lupinus angustifolius]OIW07521.1 hypothetical protein TanjilG_14467 [Lupinus angustifolius]